MKNLILIIAISALLTSCEKKEYTSTKFSVQNNCDVAIDIYSSAIVRYHDGSEEEHLHDVLGSKQKLVLREIDVTENFDIEDVFTEIRIYRGAVKMSPDPMKKSNWLKKGSAEYVLEVDSADF